MYPLFELKRVLNISAEVNLCAWTSTEAISYLALSLTNNTIVFYRLRECVNDKPVLRQLPWYGHPSKKIVTLCFDPSGSWLLIATKDATLYILPSLKFVRKSATLHPTWPIGDLTEIKLPGRRAAPTATCWWTASISQPIAIVGNELGEISFVDLLLKAEVGGTYVTVGILNLELIDDVANQCRYVLITACNGVQWQLILEQKGTNFRWPLEKHDLANTKNESSKGSTSSAALILSCLSSSEDRRNVSATKDKNSRPKRLTHFAGHTYLRTQQFRNGTVISGQYSETSILTIHTPDLNIVPLNIYKLPPNVINIFLAGKLVFATVVCGPSESRLFVIICELATTSIDGKQEYDHNATAQTFTLNDETVVRLARCKSHAGGEGVVMITNYSVYVLWPIPVTEVFQSIVLEEQDFVKADRFGKAMKLNIASLYEKIADSKLAEAQVTTAVRLYQLAKCPHVRSVANFAVFGHLPELLSYLKVLFSTPNSDFTQGDLRHFSNMALYCHMQQLLDTKTGIISQRRTFREFLCENRYYDESLAICLLSGYGEYDLLLEIADWRGLMVELLNEILPHDIKASDQSSNGINLRQRWADSDTAEMFLEMGYGSLIALDTSESFLKCLLHHELKLCFGLRPDLLKRHLAVIRRLFPHWNHKPDYLIVLQQIYNPLEQSMTPIFWSHSRYRSLSCTSTDYGSGCDFMTVGTLKEIDVAVTVAETYLQLLALLNKAQSLDRRYDLTLVTSKQRPNERQISHQEQKESEDITGSLSTVPQVCCGFAHVSAVINGRVYTWGRSAYGCLGTGSVRKDWLPAELVPLPKPPIVRVITVASGAAHTLALTDVGLYAWGCDRFGQLGLGYSGGIMRKRCHPTLVEKLIRMNIASVACGQYHSLVLMADGTVYSWGWGVHGQLGHGNSAGLSSPQKIEAFSKCQIKQISGGYGHSIFLTVKGLVYTCGNGTFGQLGHGQTSKANKPIPLDLGSETVVFATAGYFHNVAVSHSGSVYVWGCNPQVLRLRTQVSRRARLVIPQAANTDSDFPCVEEMQLNSIYDPQNSPGVFIPGKVDISNLEGRVVHAACGSTHSIVITDLGRVYSWGRNLDGQLGIEGRKEKVIPVALAAFEHTKVIYTACGADFTILADDKGRLWGFGVDDFGQISGGTQDGVSSTAQASSLPGKIVTLRTSKRIVQIKSPTRCSIFKARQLDKLGCITLEDFPTPRKNKWMMKIEGQPGSTCFLHNAIEELHGSYDDKIFQEFCEQLELWQAAAKVAVISGRTENSFELNLKALEEDLSLEKLAENSLAIVDIYVSHVDSSPEFLSVMLENIILFWQRHTLPLDYFEEFFMRRITTFGNPLATTLLGNLDPDSPMAYFCSQLSNQFCLTVVRSVYDKINKGEQLIKLETSLMGLNDDSSSWVNGHGSEVHKKSIDLTTGEVKNLLQNSMGQDPSQVAAFTCGHHYLLSNLRTLILPRFEDVLAEVAPQASKSLRNAYSTPGFQPLACPKCLIEWLIEETLPLLQ